MAKKKKDKPAPSKEKQNFLGAAGRNMKNGQINNWKQLVMIKLTQSVIQD